MLARSSAEAIFIFLVVVLCTAATTSSAHVVVANSEGGHEVHHHHHYHQEDGTDRHRQVENKELYCRRCGALITESNAHRHVPQTISTKIRDLETLKPGAKIVEFQNPQGENFEVVTFSSSSGQGVESVQNVGTSGKPEAAATFFPPYGWQVATCSRCGAHIGWHFTHPGNQETGQCPLEIPFDGRKAYVENTLEPRKAAAVGGMLNSLSASDHADDVLKLEGIVNGLFGLCQAVSQGYWTYEYCFKKSVKQFHLEPVPKGYKGPKQNIVEVNKNSFFRAPNWSLGKFRTEASLPEDLDFGSPAKDHVYLSHHFVGGQNCDETGKGRFTEVRHYCCLDAASTSTTQAVTNIPEKWVGVTVRDIKETATCRYLLHVCVPSLCKLKTFKAGGIGGQSNGVATEALDKTNKPSQQNADVQTKAPCSFFGLLWDKLVSRDSEALRWIAAVKPVTGISQ
eukprot:Stramenopile-MAST_4_protein_186